MWPHRNLLSRETAITVHFYNWTIINILEDVKVRFRSIAFVFLRDSSFMAEISEFWLLANIPAFLSCPYWRIPWVHGYGVRFYGLSSSSHMQKNIHLDVSPITVTYCSLMIVRYVTRSSVQLLLAVKACALSLPHTKSVTNEQKDGPKREEGKTNREGAKRRK
jgi:hypothetical protein